MHNIKPNPDPDTLRRLDVLVPKSNVPIPYKHILYYQAITIVTIVYYTSLTLCF